MMDVSVHSPDTEIDRPSNPGEILVPASMSLYERRLRTLKADDTFAVFDHSGDAWGGVDCVEGIYHRDTRYLSRFHLTINGGVRPVLLSSALRDDNFTLTCDLTNPDVDDGRGRRLLSNDLIHIRRTCFLWQGAAYERVALRNHDSRAHRLTVEIGFAADFADLFEVRGTKRNIRGKDRPPYIGDDLVILSYHGLDDVVRNTSIHLSPRPDSLSADQAVFDIELQPHEQKSILIGIRCGEPDLQLDLRQEVVRSVRDARRSLRLALSQTAAVSSSHEICNQLLHRCVADIHMLVTDTEHGPYPYAGIPWFSTVFGRDALITALQILWLDPAIARGVLSYLAAHQATSFDAEADAEPGKILHEVRHGEMAILGEVPFRHYYGSIDSTPLFVMLAGAYLERTNDVAFIREIWPNIEAALQWIDVHGDRDGDGYVEYGRMTEQGLQNQGWKDSHDSIFHADGTMAVGPIALVEVQAYVYGAWRAAAEMAEALGDISQAHTLRARSDALRQRFDRDFFDPELGTYVLALDGEKRPCRVRTSNAGHALFTGIAFPERAAEVVRTLMAPASFSGWGIRTVASTEARYNPMSYHNGSIWPHDNAVIAGGFARYGFRSEAGRIFEALLGASSYVDLQRLPELFCGFPRRMAQGPTFYPVACIPQAWAAAAPLYLLQSCLGLSFGVRAGHVIFDQPVLPPAIDELHIRNLNAGEGRCANVFLRRSGCKVVVEVANRVGDFRVLSVA